MYDTHIGMTLVYTVFNLSFAAWLLKGFIDEIPIEYEEAALVDGYSRLQAFRKIVLPQCVTGIAATAVFCLIFAWNEFAFGLYADQLEGPDCAAQYRDDRGRWWYRVGGDCSGFVALPDPRRHRHLCPAQAPVAGCDLRRDPAIRSPSPQHLVPSHC